uniref:Uncharacterized protein n=1 Tax=Arundo donax TaxID=35708 RepID=A0A0A9GS17_ARUDO
MSSWRHTGRSLMRRRKRRGWARCTRNLLPGSSQTTGCRSRSRSTRRRYTRCT